MNLHFEYFNISVAQKLTKLSFFGSAAVKSCYSSHGCQKSMLEALYKKTCLPKCSRNSLNLHFDYLNISVAQKLTELRFFLAQQLLTAIIQVTVAENQC